VASQAREKTRSHPEHGIAFEFLVVYNTIPDISAAQLRILDISRRYGRRTHVIKRMVSVTGYPQPVEKNSKFSSHRDDRSFLAIFSVPFEHASAPAFELTVGQERPNKYRAHQEALERQLGFQGICALINQSETLAQSSLVTASQ
jgi:hypothetical protein